MAILAFSLMIVLRRINPKIPHVLVAVVITTLLSVFLGFQKNVEIGLGQIRSEDVKEDITFFNAVVIKRERLEKLRSETNKTLPDLMSNMTNEASALCAQCHMDRDITAITVPPDPVGETQIHSRNVVAIHHMAGLIDTSIDRLKKQASDVRTDLRARHFERVVETNGQLLFFLCGQVPESLHGDGARWRINIGGGALDEDKVVLVGGGAVVGVIPAGLPPITLPSVRDHLAVLLQLIPAAIIISLLGFMEAISIAKAMAAKTRQKLDPNQELIGQGLANIIGCCGQSYACSGSFSRSAVNLQAGARTGMSNVFSSGIVVLVLLFLTPLLYHLPQAVLAAIIMMAVIGLLNVSGFVHAWRVQKFDGITAIVSFAGTLAFAPHLEWGILMGVVLSLGGYLVRTMRPKVASLSPHPDGSLRDARRHHLRQCSCLAVIRFDGPLNFASVNYLEKEVLEQVADMRDLNHVLIDGNGINEIDASGEEMLRHLIQELRSTGCHVSFTELNDHVLDVLKRTHLYDLIGEDHVFSTQAQAVAMIYAAAHAGSTERDCPFRTLMPRATEISLYHDGSLRDAQRRHLPVCEHIAIFRFDDPLNLANTRFLEQEILKLVSDRPRLRQVMFAAGGVADIDTSGARKLSQRVERLRNDGYDIVFSSFKDNVLDLLDRIGVVKIIGEDHIYPTQALAIAGVYPTAHRDSTEKNCPLLPLLPHVTELSLHPDGSLRDARRHGLKLCRQIAAIRFDGPLNFATIDYLEGELLERLKDRDELNHVLIASHGINAIDTRAAKKLCLLVERLRQKGYQVSFSGLKDNVLDVLHHTGAYQVIREEHIYPTQALAIAGIYPASHEDTAEERCPLLEVV